jgi:hypothetical protein
MTKYLRTPFLLFLCLIFGGWGFNGHKVINNKTVFSFPEEMAPFRLWQAQLEAHASDADNRKGSDPTEGPKHYIDIDNYPEFLSNGYISQNFDSLVALHGYNFVMDQGVLPWAIIAAYDSLKATFMRRDWNKAIFFAADLGHYTGDAHMPLHLTRNYNGQFTGQTGIHSRYESTMINRYYTQIIFPADTASLVEDVPDFVFEMIYANYLYLDSLLIAEAAAKAIAGNTSSDLYYEKLWEFTKDFTTLLFRNSSYSLARLIFSAWDAAGRPYEIVTAVEETGKDLTFSLDQNYPNPFNPSTVISYTVPEFTDVVIAVYSVTGELVSEVISGYHAPGDYSVTFNSSSLPAGVYFYTAAAGSSRLSRKMILLK